MNPEAPCLKKNFSFLCNNARMARSEASDNLVVLQPKTNSGKSMFSYSAAVLFNALPFEIKLTARTPLNTPTTLASLATSIKSKLRALFENKLNSASNLEELCCFACHFLLYCGCYFI